MNSVDRIGAGLPPRQIEHVADKRRRPEPDQQKHRKNQPPPEKSSDGRDHIIDELA
jgi:hypothetical protein